MADESMKRRLRVVSHLLEAFTGGAVFAMGARGI